LFPNTPLTRLHHGNQCFDPEGPEPVKSVLHDCFWLLPTIEPAATISPALFQPATCRFA